jgi:hypothetical protein
LAWQNTDGSDFQASANDIIQWDGEQWNIIFDSKNISQIYYITNVYTGVQYIWQNQTWSKSYDGIYSPANWSLVL